MPLMPMPPIPMKCTCCEVANMMLKNQGSRARANYKLQLSAISF